MRELFLPLGYGLTGKELSQAPALGEGTINFYPDGEGYLVNYPGRTDLFRRVNQPPPELGLPPSTTPVITRLMTFRDVRGKEHLVFVQGADLCETVGNGYRVLYTLKGQSYEDGKYFPFLFVHEAKLVVCNFGDPVLLWDGLDGVHSLGVQEVPLAPEVNVGKAPWTDDGNNGLGISHAYGPWAYPSYWWPQKLPSNGLGLALGADGVTKVKSLVEVVIQYFDKYGNHGAVSAPSKLADIKPNVDVSSPAFNPAAEYNDTPTWEQTEFLSIDFLPPMTEDHIVGVRIGRTLSLNPDGGAGTSGVYFTDCVQEEVCSGRRTLLKSDGVIANQTQIDTSVRGPPQATLGCSFRRRILLAGLDDPYLVAISDTELFGQFRITNFYRANDHVRALVVLGDRVVVITRSSTEVLYETNEGVMAVLEQDYANGSLYGRSIIEVGGTLFGLFNRGFAFYDGTKFQQVETPYFVQALYMAGNFYVYSAAQWNDWYVLSVRKDMVTDQNNYLLLFHLPTGRWFLLEESVFDVTVWQESLLGCDDSLYELFKGYFTSAAKLVVKGLIPEEASPLTQRNLIDTRILIEPSSFSNFDFEVKGEFTTTPASGGEMHSLPSKQAASRQAHPVPYWNVKFQYDDEHEWAAPSDVWIVARAEKGVSGFRHSMTFEFPASHRVRLKALGLTFGEEVRSGVT